MPHMASRSARNRGTNALSAARALVSASAGLGVACGSAVWVTLGTLDASTTPEGFVRIALLPSLWTWAALVVVATASVGGVVRWLARAAPNRSRAEATAALRPLGASAVLVLPYLPWVADAFPVLTVLAGPVRWVVWFVAVAESIRNIAASVRSSDGDGIVMTSGRVALLLFVTGALLSAFAAARLTGTSLFPGGDEPHYLIMAQSLWRDGDLAIEDNHAREEYKEYYATTDVLAPHYLTRGTDGEIYSVPPRRSAGRVGPGLRPLGATRRFGYCSSWCRRRLARSSFSGCRGSGCHSRSGVVFGWLAVYASAPFFLLSFAVFPEMLAGLTVVCALRVVTRPDGQNVAWASSSLRWVRRRGPGGLPPLAKHQVFTDGSSDRDCRAGSDLA